MELEILAKFSNNSGIPWENETLFYFIYLKNFFKSWCPLSFQRLLILILSADS